MKCVGVREGGRARYMIWPDGRCTADVALNISDIYFICIERIPEAG